MRLLRQLGRRRMRTTLTILGITIGIWALVVFSAMSNRINALVDGGGAYYEGKVQVTDASNAAVGAGTNPMSISVADEVRALEGVAAVSAQVQMGLGTQGGIRLGAAETIVGAVAGSDGGHETFPLRLLDGRHLAVDDEGARVVVLGSILADKFGARVGERIDLRGQTFEVVGLLEPTLTQPDYTAFVPLAAAQELLDAMLPSPVREAIRRDELSTQVIVYPAPGTTADQLAATIEAGVDNVTTLTSSTYDEQYGSAAVMFNAILVGIGVISLVVGGLSVINTMAMSVAERTREIGIKRAIGGSRGRIVRELVTEAGVIGLIGGIIGLVLGAVVVVVANDLGRRQGVVLFEMTASTAVFAVVFSTLLGVLAGLFPAWNAARLDPVAALRYE